MPSRCSVALCDDSSVLPSSSLDVMSFEIMTRTIVVAACFSRCIFVPEYVIASVFLPGNLVGPEYNLLN